MRFNGKLPTASIRKVGGWGGRSYFILVEIARNEGIQRVDAIRDIVTVYKFQQCNLVY